MPAERLAGCSPSIIGVGATGRQVALQLAAIGVPHLKMINFDTVEQVNRASQGFLENDLGRAKARGTEVLYQAVALVLESVTSQDAFGWFEPCGYRQIKG